jgi:hypothetical protein
MASIAANTRSAWFLHAMLSTEGEELNRFGTHKSSVKPGNVRSLCPPLSGITPADR